MIKTEFMSEIAAVNNEESFVGKVFNPKFQKLYKDQLNSSIANFFKLHQSFLDILSVFFPLFEHHSKVINVDLMRYQGFFQSIHFKLPDLDLPCPKQFIHPNFPQQVLILDEFLPLEFSILVEVQPLVEIVVYYSSIRLFQD